MLTEAQNRPKALVKRRRQLVEMRKAEKTRLDRVQEAVESSLNEHVRYLDGQIEEVETELKDVCPKSWTS